MGVICVTLATGTSACCSCSLLLFAAGEHPWASHRKRCAAPRRGEPSARGYQRAGTQGTGRCEPRLTQICPPCSPLLQLLSSGLQRTSSESVWQEQDQQLCASPLHRFLESDGSHSSRLFTRLECRRMSECFMNIWRKQTWQSRHRYPLIT